MIIEPNDLFTKLMEIKKRNSSRKGVSTGFACMDEFIYLSKQYLMVLTGMPSCGKSEFLDGIAMNTALLHEWKWVYFSPENYPLEEHLKKTVERRLGDSLSNCCDTEIRLAVEWANECFCWLHPEDTENYALHDILAEVETMIHEGKQIDVLVIDPWNELNHVSQAGMRDDQYISKCLTTLRQFHRKYNILTCIVIHPTKLQKDATGKYPVPSLYDCNGGAMWRNKADFGICVHRHDMFKNEVSVYIQKVKFKTMGKIGEVKLDYQYHSGRFKSVNEASYCLPE